MSGSSPILRNRAPVKVVFPAPNPPTSHKQNGALAVSTRAIGSAVTARSAILVVKAPTSTEFFSVLSNVGSVLGVVKQAFHVGYGFIQSAK